MPSPSLDVLAIAAHRDDVEQTCGGTLLKMAGLGRRTGILDLTRGEMGTRGNAEDRQREAEAAAKILRASWREALDIPDGRVENTWENRLKVARVIRRTRPRVVILPYWKGRHPDAAKRLEVDDVLVDAMRGRSSTWTRIRVNLRHVPEDQRPAEEAPDPDYDPWRKMRSSS